MNSKTVIIAGGVVVVGFVAWRVLKAKGGAAKPTVQPAASTAQNVTNTINTITQGVGAIASLGKGAKDLFSGDGGNDFGIGDADPFVGVDATVSSLDDAGVVGRGGIDSPLPPADYSA